MSSDFGQNTPDIQTLDTLSSAVSLIGVIAGALGTMNTMVMNVFERTREIGTFRAIGWRRTRVMGMIVGEALVMSFIGGGVGILFGFGLAAMTSRLPALVGYFSLEVTVETLVSGILIAVVLGILGGIIPAWWASRLSPIEALKYE
jgi:putative ABC transport system permease protein